MTDQRTWTDGQPNVFAGQPCDQSTSYRGAYRGDDWRISVRHDPISGFWFPVFTPCGEHNQRSAIYSPHHWPTREAGKAFIDAHYIRR